jgi:hypothetical protein
MDGSVCRISSSEFGELQTGLLHVDMTKRGLDGLKIMTHRLFHQLCHRFPCVLPTLNWSVNWSKDELPFEWVLATKRKHRQAIAMVESTFKKFRISWDNGEEQVKDSPV